MIKIKPTTFVTTFSQKGYCDYGQRWVETFIKNTSEVNAVIFTDFDLVVSDSRVTILNFDELIPEHKSWLKEFNTTYSKHTESERNEYEKLFGIRFSYKAHVIMYAIAHMAGYVVWLDGDCVFKPNSYSNFASSILENNFIAVQVDKVSANDVWKTEDHVESGIVVFDMDHPDKNKFLDKFTELYDPAAMVKMERPYDGFVIYRTCKEIDFVDLFPPNYTITDLNPNLTFIHPELQQRFIHNIGNKSYLDILSSE